MPTMRITRLFARVERTAARLVVILEEERALRKRLEELWREKTSVVAALADEARDASLSEIEDVLNRQRKAKR